MLLYGPPGTGKSKIAEVLAEALGFSLLTVTPSDFITAGGEAVEARAKAIFQVLQEQTDLVVLFDEVDNLLLDRDSKFYREQGDIFKLLTPGMLTKLNGLARRRRVVLIVATNYYERIDRAIKRPGRIDARYLVLPPDQAQRGAFLRTVVDGWDRIPGAKRTQIEQATVRFTYQELYDLWAYVVRRRSTTQSKKLEQALLEAIEQVRPIITLGAYTARLGMEGVPGEAKSETSADTLERAWEEFALLAYLELEALGKLPDQPEWLPKALQNALHQRAIADPRIADKLSAALPGGNAPLRKVRGK